MNQTNQSEKDKKIKNISTIIAIGIFIMLFLYIRSCFSTSSNTSKDKVTDQKRMVQATTQRVLKNYNISESTSPSLEDWNINSQAYNDTKRWTATTNGTYNKRIKCIFEWSGDDRDDLILVYLLYDGKEFVNDLR